MRLPAASVIILVPKGSQLAVYQVSQVKKAMIAAVSVDVNLGSAPRTKATPSKISPTQMNTDSGSATSLSPGKLSAPGSKYSSSLYIKPSASLALISPDTINNDPTSRRQAFTIALNAFMFVVLSNIESSINLRRNPILLLPVKREQRAHNWPCPHNSPLLLLTPLFYHYCLRFVSHEAPSSESNPSAN